MSESNVPQYRLKPERTFSCSEREQVTLLSGGLTRAHEQLVEAGLRSLGYRHNVLPTPDLEAYELGRTHCSNGLCNPAYFTIGNLLKYLRREQQRLGLTGTEVCDRYALYTAGARGPCRFGMYESEYRFALESAGFPGFRVLVFQQGDGFLQAAKDAGLVFDADFIMVHVKAIMLGDIVNELYHKIKPYEIEAGATDRACQRVVAELRGAMGMVQASTLRRGLQRLSNSLWLGSRGRRTAHLAAQVTTFTDEMNNTELIASLALAVRHFDLVRVDRRQSKPVVKVTGEFWAQTTDGDGNFRMFDVLEQHGAEVLVEPIITWIQYLFHMALRDARARAGLATGDRKQGLAALTSRANSWLREPVRGVAIETISAALARVYNNLRAAVQNSVLPLADQAELVELGEPYYHPEIRGGEGHLEVGKTLHYTQHKLAHMVLALKPFGCMPSTMSDGIQPLLLAHHPEVLFLSVETSADGKDAALTRVEMMLAEARGRAREEYTQWLQQAPYSVDEQRWFVEQHPELQRGMLPLCGQRGGISTAIRFGEWVCALMQARSLRPGFLEAQAFVDAMALHADPIRAQLSRSRALEADGRAA